MFGREVRTAGRECECESWGYDCALGRRLDRAIVDSETAGGVLSFVEESMAWIEQ